MYPNIIGTNSLYRFKQYKVLSCALVSDLYFPPLIEWKPSGFSIKWFGYEKHSWKCIFPYVKLRKLTGKKMP